MHLRTDTNPSGAHFARVPTISRSRNSFSIAEKHVTTIGFDKLYPLWHKFIYPGDTLNIDFKSMARLQTQGWILYDDLYFDAHAWFVPFRLIQTNWARFQYNAQPAGPTQDNSSLTTPGITFPGGGVESFAAKSLYDYFGYPTGIDFAATSQHINNYLPRAYNLIWNENYRDENLQTPMVVDLDDGPDSITDYFLNFRGKRHDKFTSCLPFMQKGPTTRIPIGSFFPVNGIPGSPLRLQDVDQSSPSAPSKLEWNSTVQLYPNPPFGNDPAEANVAFPGYSSGLAVDLTNSILASVNQWRQSVAVQHLLEADARGGTRDVESIQHRWGVTVPDFRMQRPEYLGGQTWTFDGHVVPQTSESNVTPQGNLTQFSQTMSAMPVTHSFVEPGVFMILVSARSNITYQGGLARELSHKTRFDFYQPEFANLGEVAVYTKELLATTNDTYNEDPFGYNEYGYWLRYSENRVSAEMRSNYTQSLDMKHMAEDFLIPPLLGPGFIWSQTPIGRNIVVQPNVADPIEMNILVQGSIARVLPMYSIPGLTRL